MHEKLGLVLLSEVTKVCFRIGGGSVQEHLPENVKKDWWTHLPSSNLSAHV